MIEYFKSGRFYETLVLVLFIVLVVAVGKFFDKKYLKTKSANSKWYRSTRMINDFIKAIIITILVFAILSVNGFEIFNHKKLPSIPHPPYELLQFPQSLPHVL